MRFLGLRSDFTALSGKLPERLIVLETMPRNAVGKTLKFEL